MTRVLVAIAPDAGFEDDDYDLFVYDNQGVLVGSLEGAVVRGHAVDFAAP